jgi:transposase InsO family protein
MTRQGDCYDDSCAETFFHTLKVELTQGVRNASREQRRREVFEYIEIYYNTIHRHNTLRHISPAAFEALEVAQPRVHMSRVRPAAPFQRQRASPW